MFDKGVVWLFRYDIRYDMSVGFDVSFDMNLMVKKYDFDRVMLSVDWVLLESIDFTCVLSDFWL